MADVNKTVKVTYQADVGPLERGIKKIPNTTRKEMRDAIRSVEAGLKKAQKQAAKTAASMRANFKKAATGIGMVGGALATAGAGVLAFGQQMADLTNDLVDTSTKTGIAVETLSALRLAAEGSGLAFEQFIGPLQRLQRHMVEANKGTKLSVELFDDMGIQVTDTTGQLRGADEVFREMMSTLGEMDSDLERNALLMEAFGKSGAMLAQAGVIGGLEDFVSLSRTFGSETMPDAITQAANFQRAMADLNLVGTGTMQSILMTITGTGGLTDAIDRITEGVIYFEAAFKTAFAAVSIPVTVLQGELYTLATFLTEGLDAGRAAWSATSDLVNKDVEMLNNSFAMAEEKITALRQAREKIRGGSTATGETGQETPKTGEENAKKEATAIEKLTEVRRTDLETLKEFQGIQEKLRKQQNDLRDDMLNDEQIAMKQHSQRMQALDDELNAVQRRYANEFLALQELYDNKEITEEEGMNRLAALEKEVLDVVDQANFAKAASYRRMQRDINEIQEEAAKKEIERQMEIAAATREQFTSTAITIADSVAALHEQEVDRIEKMNEESFKALDSRVEKGLLTEEEAAKKKQEIEETNQKFIESHAIKAYNIKKATSIAQIMIDAATAAARAFAEFPFPASAVVSGLVAGSALAQIAVVDNVPPPTFDMGGMIGNRDNPRPDERIARVLEGEAILDRATVGRLGGSQGVRNLQNGQNGGGVVVIQPFKHFDRFIRTQNRRSKKRTGRGSY